MAAQPLALPIYRVSLVQEGAIRYDQKMRDSKCVAQLLWDYLADTDREHFVVILVDQKNRLIGINTVSIGSMTASVVHPREVWKPAILCNAAAVLLGHNHPSGDPQPSREDRAMTTRLVEAGKLLGITVLDHVIIGGNGKYFSFADEGLMDSSSGEWGG